MTPLIPISISVGAVHFNAGVEMFTDENEIEPAENEDELLDDEDKQKIEDGEVCANCGSEFEANQGEPALCADCWTATPEEDRKGYTKSGSDVIPF